MTRVYHPLSLTTLTLPAIFDMSGQTAPPPAWLRDDIEDNTPLRMDTSGHPSMGGQMKMPPGGQPIGYASPTSSSSSPIQGKKNIIFWIMRVVCLLLCVLMVLTALLGLGKFAVLHYCIFLT